jgi:hypothetical protein
MLREILALARKHQLSTYDASYLDLAIRQEVPLFTLDSGLSTADSGRTKKRPAILESNKSVAVPNFHKRLKNQWLSPIFIKG